MNTFVNNTAQVKSSILFARAVMGMPVNVSLIYMLNNLSVPGSYDPTFLMLELVINGYLMSIVCTIGLFGNAWLLITLFVNRTLWRQMRPYILFLTVCDTLMLCVAWFMFSRNSLMAHGILPDWSWNIYTWSYSYALANLTFMAHIWGTVAFTIERYTAICHPLWHRAKKPKYLAMCFLGCTVLLSLGYSLPRFFETIVVAEFGPYNDTVLSIRENSLRNNPTYRLFYRSLGQLLFMTGVPLVIIGVLTFRMTVALHKSSKMPRHTPGTIARRKSPLGSVGGIDAPGGLEVELVSINDHGAVVSRVPSPLRSSYNTVNNSISCPRPSKFSIAYLQAINSSFNRALIALLITAMFSYSLPTVVDFVELFREDSDENRRHVSYLTLLSNFMVVLDGACAFYIYFLCNKQFRKLAHGRCNRNGHSKFAENLIENVSVKSKLSARLSNSRSQLPYQDQFPSNGKESRSIEDN